MGADREPAKRLWFWKEAIVVVMTNPGYIFTLTTNGSPAHNFEWDGTNLNQITLSASPVSQSLATIRSHSWTIIIGAAFTWRWMVLEGGAGSFKMLSFQAWSSTILDHPLWNAVSIGRSKL